MSRARLLVAALVVARLVVFFAAGGQRYFTFENLKAQQAAVEAWYAAHPWQTALGFFAVYVAVTALSLPGAALLTLAAGAIFGLLLGHAARLLRLVASAPRSPSSPRASCCATGCRRASATQLRGDQRRAWRRRARFYLFTLRLMPAVPFFVINLAMGLTPIRAWTFYWVSQLGMLAGTLVYVNAGTQLARARVAARHPVAGS